MPQTRPLKIAYLCETHPDITWAHSGGNTRIYNALKQHVGEVTVIDTRWGALEFLRKLINRMPHSIKYRLRFRAHLLFSRVIGRHVSKQLAADNYDVLFCAYSFFCLADVKLPYPLRTVFTSDATYTAYKHSQIGQAFGSFFSVSRIFDPLILKMEQQVYGDADLLLWPSHWIKQAADKLYGLDSRCSKVVHWGANIAAPSEDEIKRDNLVAGGPVRLLLVGRDWQMKGGPLVYQVLETLLGRGVDAQLTVVGCELPEDCQHPNITHYRQLYKTDPGQYALFRSLYRDAHFFVMPSYEAYGFAFCEAGAFALPSLCLRVGGIPVIDEVNGHALPETATAEQFADKIQSYLADSQRYLELRNSTREHYEKHLHWDAWGENVAKVLKKTPPSKEPLDLALSRIPA